MYLEMPLKMAGSPGIYKLDKGIFFGVKDLLKKVPYSWWPPKAFKLYQLGRFDLFPLEFSALSNEEVMKRLGKLAISSKLDVLKTNLGCFHLKGFLNLKE